MLWSFILAGQASAQSFDSAWQAETRFYLSGMSYYWAMNDDTVHHDTIAATGELRLKRDARPWYASVFVDYRYSTRKRYSDKTSIGGYINFGRYRWDTRAYVFVLMTARAKDTWFHAGRLRYRVASNHKLGVEVIGSFEQPDSTLFLLAWYSDITDSVSLTLAAGRGASEGPELSARMELVWRVF